MEESKAFSLSHTLCPHDRSRTCGSSTVHGPPKAICRSILHQWPIPVSARSKAWVYGRYLTGIVGSNPAEGLDVFSLVSVVCCQEEVFVSG